MNSPKTWLTIFTVVCLLFHTCQKNETQQGLMTRETIEYLEENSANIDTILYKLGIEEDAIKDTGKISSGEMRIIHGVEYYQTITLDDELSSIIFSTQIQDHQTATSHVQKIYEEAVSLYGPPITYDGSSNQVSDFLSEAEKRHKDKEDYLNKWSVSNGVSMDFRIHCKNNKYTINIVYLFRQSEPETEEIHALAEGKTDWYESEEDLFKAADVVIKALRTDREQETEEYFGDSVNYYYGYTISNVKILSIIKDNSGNGLKENDWIPVIENQFTHYDNKIGKNVTYHLNQYNKMIEGNTYYLYMTYSENDQWYVPLTGLEGKINVDEDEDLLFPLSKMTGYGSDLEESEAVLSTMKQIREDCLKKYE